MLSKGDNDMMSAERPFENIHDKGAGARAHARKTLTTSKAEPSGPKLFGIAWLAIQVALAYRYAKTHM